MRLKSLLWAGVLCAGVLAMIGCVDDVGLSGSGGKCSTSAECQQGLVCYAGSCHSDGDGDGIADVIDNCPNVANPDQQDSNNNGVGDACESSQNNTNNTNNTNNNNANNDTDAGNDDVDPGGDDTDHGDTGNGGDDSGNNNDIYIPIDPDETRRNGRPTNDQCQYVAPTGAFEPDLKWQFMIKDTDPYARHSTTNHPISQVMMTPVVANLTDDNNDGVIDENDTPDIIFTTFSTSMETTDPTNAANTGHDFLYYGVLRAISGDDGRLLWSVGATELGLPNQRSGVQPGGSIAVGDINGNGKNEIIVGLWGDLVAVNGLAAISHDGKLLWKTTDHGHDIPHQFAFWWGGPSLADLDGDGTPEIVIGPLVFDNTGKLKWDGRSAVGLVGPPGQGINWRQGNSSNISYTGMLSLVADLDMVRDPVSNRYTQEVVTGRTAYTHDGKVKWEARIDLPDGFPAIGDFNGDGFPEVVVSANGTVRIHDGQNGDLIWGPVQLPGGRIGPPTIADFTGDGYPEIGVAGSTRYMALKVDVRTPGHNKTPSYNDVRLWEAVTQDGSSNMTGSSLFDFNGDKRAEVVYNDELHLYVFNGLNGEVLFKQPNTSYTALEYPIIVDVNNDGAANIVVASNDFECGDKVPNCQRGFAGIKVFGDAQDNWVSTRRIWNQHAYSINNVEENGRIPAQPDQSWVEHNTFRLNRQTHLPAQAAPDLVGENGTISRDGCDSLLRAWVTNSGAVRVGAGIPVSFYAVRGATRTFLGEQRTLAGLEPGESERVEMQANLPVGGPWDIIAVVDDLNGSGQGTRNECNESNNTAIIASNVTCG